MRPRSFRQGERVQLGMAWPGGPVLPYKTRGEVLRAEDAAGNVLVHFQVPATIQEYSRFKRDTFEVASYFLERVS